MGVNVANRFGCGDLRTTYTDRRPSSFKRCDETRSDRFSTSKSIFSFINVQLSALRNILTRWLLYPTPVAFTGFQLASAVGVMTHRTSSWWNTAYICGEINYQIC